MSATRAVSLFIGVDGGGTACRARIEDETGRYLGAGLSGAATTRLGIDTSVAAITRACLAACEDAGLAPEALREMHAGIGLAGIGRKGALEELQRRELPFRSATFESDAVIACLGAHGGQDGGIVIAGTGSVGLALLNGRQLRIGGHGFPISDEGSGAEIGLHAIRLSLRAHDRRIAATAFTRDVMARFGDDAYAVVAWSERATATDYASFAPRVIQYAEEDDPLAIRIVANAARQIGVMVSRLKDFGAPRVALLGGLSAPLSRWLTPEIKAQLTLAEHDAIAGALLLARRNAAIAQSRERSASMFARA